MSKSKVKICIQSFTTTSQSGVSKVEAKKKKFNKKANNTKRKNKITSQQYSVFNYIESYFA